MTTFKPSRADGRSDKQVVYDLVEAAAPDTVFSFEQLIDALSEGLTGEVTRSRVYQAVAVANRSLLRRRKRSLRVARGHGYRVARSNEAVELARLRTDRAQVQTKRAHDHVQHTRLDELTPGELTILRGTQIALSNLYQAFRHLDRKINDTEQAIRAHIETTDHRFQQLAQRVEQLETTTTVKP
jgi:hypothetical protein